MKTKTKVIAAAATGLIVMIGSGFVVVRDSAAKVAPKPPAETVLTTRADKLSYGVGATMARSFKRQGVELDVDALTKGLRDGLSDKKLLMTDDELRDSSVALQSEIKGKRAHISKEAAAARDKEGRAFLSENARKEGIVTLPSGLQYKVLKTAPGQRPTDSDSAECQYRGTFIDGTEFDSSERHGRPAILKLSNVIPGWREALKLMPTGSKWRLFVPPQLAYGELGFGGKKGSPRLIEPNTTLVFDVELLAINPPQPTNATAPK